MLLVTEVNESSVHFPAATGVDENNPNPSLVISKPFSVLFDSVELPFKKTEVKCE